MSTDAVRLTIANPNACGQVAELLTVAETLPPDDRLRLMIALWTSLPLSQPAAANGGQLSELQRCLAGYDATPGIEFPWPAVSQLLAGSSQKKLQTVYSVPRRFDLSTIFVVTLAYSLLFGMMSMLSFPPAVSISVGGFVTLIGVAQAALFGGKCPRLASVIVGALIFGGASLAIWIAGGQRIYPPSAFVYIGGYTIATGAMLGYLAGTIVGGIFLIADKCRKRFSQTRGNRADNQPMSEAYEASRSDSQLL